MFFSDSQAERESQIWVKGTNVRAIAEEKENNDRL